MVVGLGIRIRRDPDIRKLSDIGSRSDIWEVHRIRNLVDAAVDLIDPQLTNSVF